MLLFSAENLAQNFAGRDIFTGVNFEVQAGEKLAIVGANGVGKSSLLRIIAGIDQAVEGSIKYYNRTSCGLLTQFYNDEQVSTVLEALEEALPAGALLRAPGEAIKKFAFIGQEAQPVAKLSGGEKTRLQLARIWLSGAELLLLDEPGNHLDAENLEWLESFINEYPDTVVLVSHDRYFLDRTVNRVLELRSDGVTSYAGNYSFYYHAKLEQRVRDEKTYWDQQKQAEKLNNAIQEQQEWAGKAHDQAARKARDMGIKGAKVFFRNKAKKNDRRVKNNIKRLERLEEERIARPEKVRTIDLAFTGERRAHKEILRAEDIAKAFGSRSLFADGKFSLKYGEKAALVGANGSGKTTLLRMIAGLESPDAGEIWRSPSLRLGYLEQEIDSLNRSHSVLHELAGVCPDQGRVRNLLADLLITGDAVFKPCEVLSMGEKVRVALTKLLLGTYDLLLLDEPTNYLDLPSREKLEDALTAFGGSLIVVSHDRYLLARVAQKVWAIENNQVTSYPGNYPDYIEHRSIRHTQKQAGESDRLELEFKKARLISELSIIDRTKDEGRYMRLEQEFLEVIRQLRNTSG
ncbi:MAG: ribosomal protection-like ABC-F family protein [Syntrophomonas sp.]